MRVISTVRQGCANAEMSFLFRGESIETIGEPPRAVRKLRGGDYCGTNMLNETVASSSVVASSPCQCFMLHRCGDFDCNV